MKSLFYRFCFLVFTAAAVTFLFLAAAVSVMLVINNWKDILVLLISIAGYTLIIDQANYCLKQSRGK